MSVQNPKQFHATLQSLGLQPGFRYEKYRTSYSLKNLRLELDETPVGTFLELEGPPRQIDQAARNLGFNPSQRILHTYWDLYAADCRKKRRATDEYVVPMKKFRQTA